MPSKTRIKAIGSIARRWACGHICNSRVTTQQAWAWLFAQCGVGLIVLMCLPRLAQYISLLSIPLVAAYPFMKRITWFPQLWLGMTFNWAVLVAYAAKTETVSAPLFILYTGLIFWTVGYDTIYACQDIEDDMKIGVKSTARRFGSRVKLAVGVCYAVCMVFIYIAMSKESQFEYLPSLEENLEALKSLKDTSQGWVLYPPLNTDGGRIERYLLIPTYTFLVFMLPTALHFMRQLYKFNSLNSTSSLKIFKSNFTTGLIMTLSFCALAFVLGETSI